MDTSPCPKCGYVRQAHDTAPAGECPQCGLIFEKYRQYLAQRAANPRATSPHPQIAPTPLPWREWANDYLFRLPNDPSRSSTVGYALLYGVFLMWGLKLISEDYLDGEVAESVLHLVNLPFHEFGHILFRPFGEWMMFLGGSLFQCLLPLLLAGVFLFRERKPFSATFCLWWAGENLMDISPYIADASAMALPLTGEWNEGVAEFRYMRHDWHNILGPLGMLAWDHRVAMLAHTLGALLMGLAWLWGGYWLWRCWQIAR